MTAPVTRAHTEIKRLSLDEIAELNEYFGEHGELPHGVEEALLEMAVNCLELRAELAAKAELAPERELAEAKRLLSQVLNACETDDWPSRCEELLNGYFATAPAPSAGESMAAWAVRCLDAWADSVGRAPPSPEYYHAHKAYTLAFYHGPGMERLAKHSGATHAEARIAAALALYAADNTLPAPPAPTLTNDNGRTR